MLNYIKNIYLYTYLLVDIIDNTDKRIFDPLTIKIFIYQRMKDILLATCLVIEDGLDGEPHLALVGVVEVADVLDLLLEPPVVLLLDLAPDLLLVLHLLGGRDGLPVQGLQPLDEAAAHHNDPWPQL